MCTSVVTPLERERAWTELIVLCLCATWTTDRPFYARGNLFPLVLGPNPFLDLER